MSPTGKLFADHDVMTECLLLPHEAYPGISPVNVVGEVMLQELEDDEETISQLFFKADGTISHGATDGPPPAGFCGLWQCGGSQFQMTLSRAFTTVNGATYTVVRAYEGNVNVEGGGIGTINGRIDLINEEDIASWSGTGATSMAALDPFSIVVPPVGYFVIDTDIAFELATE